MNRKVAEIAGRRLSLSKVEKDLYRLARAQSPETPDSMVFDLDPGDQAGIMDWAWD